MSMSYGVRVVTLTLAAVCTWPAVASLQQPKPPTAWTEAEIRKAVAPVRAGRSLKPTTWPNNARVAVCLSFDVDNEAMARGETLPVPMSAGEYGAKVGLPRILNLLERQGVPASFYIPAHSAILHPDAVPAILKRGVHEVGVHGYIHESLPLLDDAAEEERLLTQAIDHLTQAMGKRPVGYRAPAWAFSAHTMKLIQKAGFLYDSSLMAYDEPYELLADGQPAMVELPVEWILDDAPYFGRTGALPSPETIFDVYRAEFDMAYDEGSMFMLTMHPHVIGHRSRILHLERLIAYMKSKPGVWFATAEDIATYVKRQQGSTP